jgi:hypothetical protein
MTNGVLIYGEIFEHSLIYWEAHLNFLIDQENFVIFLSL